MATRERSQLQKIVRLFEGAYLQILKAAAVVRFLPGTSNEELEIDDVQLQKHLFWVKVTTISKLSMHRQGLNICRKNQIVN